MSTTQLVSILHVHLDGTRQGITPCGIINRGINNAARLGGATFRLDFTFAYMSGEVFTTEQKQIAVVQTEAGGEFDSRSIIFTTNFQLANRVDNNTEVQGSLQLVNPPNDFVGDTATF
jgi:hypothetical protein